MTYDRHLVMLYMFLWYTEARLLSDIEERRKACRLLKHAPDDLFKLYIAEQRYNDFIEIANKITEILDH